MLTLALAVGYLFHADSKNALIAETERDGSVLANLIRNSEGETIRRLVSDAIGEDAETIRNLPAQEVLRRDFRRLTEGTPVLELTVYDSGGTVVYSEVPGQIGHSSPSDPDFLAAMLGSGRSSLFEQFSREGPGSIVLTTVPLILEGSQRIGVLEICTDVTAALARIYSRSLVMAVKAMGILAAMWIMLLVIVARGDRILSAQAKELSRLAGTDELTGLFNRRQLWQTAEREFQRAVRHQRPLSVIVMDIDHFKAVNDGFGHAVGDEAIRTLAGAIARNLRATDIAGRLGGDEFVLVLPETGAMGAAGLAERLAAELHQIGLVSMGGRGITCSQGLAEGIPGLDASFDDLVARADGALYGAKRSGRARYELHIPKPAETAAV